MKQQLANLNLPSLLIVQFPLVILFDVTVFIDRQCFHQRAKRSNREIKNLGLAKVVVVHSLFDFCILKEDIFLSNLFNFLLLLIDGAYFALKHVFLWLLITNFLHVGQLFRRNFFLDLSPCLELVHNFEHVVLQAQSSVSFALEVDFYDSAIVVNIYPSYVALLYVYFVV